MPRPSFLDAIATEDSDGKTSYLCLFAGTAVQEKKVVKD